MLAKTLWRIDILHISFTFPKGLTLFRLKRALSDGFRKYTERVQNITISKTS